MKLNKFEVNSFGPIGKASVDFGDLTILIGPQASGKSLFLQLLKLVSDKKHIRKTLEQFNYVYSESLDKLLDVYFGEGLSKLWTEKTKILEGNHQIEKTFFKPKQREVIKNSSENIFYIPAQRVISLSDGRPKSFTEFDETVPYVLKNFSDTLRLFLQRSKSLEQSVFPAQQKLKDILKDSYQDSIFHGGNVKFDERSGRKKFRMDIQDSSMPFMTWSAGQKEFMPLLLAFYYLSPSGKVSRTDNIKTIILEEPEMGLHTKALRSILLNLLELMSRGYKIVLSTHSSFFLEFAWFMKNIPKNGNSVVSLSRLFEVKNNSEKFAQLFETILKKKLKAYSFQFTNKKVQTKDISDLDPFSNDAEIADWGGLTSFATRTGDVLSELTLFDEQKNGVDEKK